MALNSAFGRNSNPLVLGVPANIRSGVWTPLVADASFAQDTQNYTIQIGTYTRIANRVFFDFRIKMISLGSVIATQALNIMGWPFAIGANSVGSAVLGQGVGLNMPASGQPVTLRFDPLTNSARMMILNSTAGHSSMQMTHLSSDGDIKVSGHYETDDE